MEKLKRNWIAWIIISVVTAIIYSATFSYGILNNYDDDEYFNDTRICQLDVHNVREYFTDYYLGMYQPIPVLSFAILHHYSPESIINQRVLQFLLHILNALLVLILVRRLTGNYWIGTLTALVFAIHPMHVESVAWLSTRSNLMYSLFYLLALILYMEWQDKNKGWLCLLMFLSFILSLFSKVTAVTFPLVIILMDWFRKKEFSTRRILYIYVPFFILSGVFIFLGLKASGSFGHISDLGKDYNLVQRFFILLEALWLYLVKFFVPAGQSAIYLYPWKINGYLPAYYYITGTLGLLIFAGAIIMGWKFRKTDPGRMLLFGLLFFLATLCVVLPLKWSRTVLIAERYTYIPYIGLTVLVLSFFFHYLKNRSVTVQYASQGILALFIVLFSYLSFERTRVWANPVTLFTDVINKNRSGAEVSMGYYNRGNEYLRLKETDKAVADYSQAIRIYPGYTNAYYNRGLVLLATGNSSESIVDFTEAIRLKDNYPDAYINRGIAYRSVGNYPAALADLSHVIDLYQDRLAYFNRGVLYYFNLNDPGMACEDWDQAYRLGFAPAGEMLEKYCGPDH